MAFDKKLNLQTSNNQRSHSKKSIESNELFLTFFHVYIIPNENRNIITFQMSFSPFVLYSPYDNTYYVQMIPIYNPDSISEPNNQINTQREELQDLQKGQVTLNDEQIKKDPQFSYQNVCQQKCSEDSYKQEKRGYRKRRKGLKKSDFCRQQGCNKSYSSQMALRNHERLQHFIRRRRSQLNSS